MSNAVETLGLGKLYRLGADGSGYDTIRDAITRRFSGRATADRLVWALRDIDLSIPAGEVLGVVGRNGAGKTTLLKVLAGITDPTAGEARIRGRVGALLEVGTGFHLELTGRENVFLSGAILGMSRSQVRRRFNDIVAFADVGRFLDTPVKRYSTGMRLRLAFAVAAHIEPPVIVVDEILAVGDASFREKCMGRMSEMGRDGRTIVFVSHDLGAITRLCDRAIWLDGGRIAADGSPREVIASYLGLGAAERRLVAVGTGDPVERVWIEDSDGRALARLRRSEAFVIAIRLIVREGLPGLDVAVWITDRDGIRVLDEAYSDRASGPLTGEAGTYEMRIRIPGILRSGPHVVGLWLGSTWEELFDQELLTLEIEPLPEDRQEMIERRRVVQPEVGWSASFEPR